MNGAVVRVSPWSFAPTEKIEDEQQIVDLTSRVSTDLGSSKVSVGR
jgi:hypothetical protein